MAHHRGLGEGLRRNPADSPARQCYTAVMCGRFYLTATATEIRRLFKLEKVPELVPRYNIAPMQSTPIVVAEETGRAVLMARWGLVPAWSRDLSPGAGMVNAPAETLEDKPAYRTAFRSQRCLVPANGFYEWHAKGARKQPYKIALRAGALIAFAGLWARWTPEGGDPVETFTIVTTRAGRSSTLAHGPECDGQEAALAVYDRTDDHRGRRPCQQRQK